MFGCNRYRLTDIKTVRELSCTVPVTKKNGKKRRDK